VGGEKDYPTYEGVGDHTEGVVVAFNPKVTSYRECLDYFFDSVSPFANCSDGAQYSSGVWWHDEEQKREIFRKVKEMETGGKKVTVITAPVTRVYSAEEYHQRFFEKNPGMEW